MRSVCMYVCRWLKYSSSITGTGGSRSAKGGFGDGVNACKNCGKTRNDFPTAVGFTHHLAKCGVKRSGSSANNSSAAFSSSRPVKRPFVEEADDDNESMNERKKIAFHRCVYLS